LFDLVRHQISRTSANPDPTTRSLGRISRRSPVVPAVRQAEPPPELAQERAERVIVTMSPLTLTVAMAEDLLEAEHVAAITREPRANVWRNVCGEQRVPTAARRPSRAIASWIPRAVRAGPHRPQNSGSPAMTAGFVRR
jgi:hypothetical protein